MNPRYFHVFLEHRIGPPKAERLRERGSNTSYDLKKIKYLYLFMFHDETKFLQKRKSNIITTKEK